MKAPCIAIERNPKNTWEILNFSSNASFYGLDEIKSTPYDFFQIIHPEDHEIISRKLGGAILQRKHSISLRYRLKTSKTFFWCEEILSIDYSHGGEINSISGIIWLSTLTTEWALLQKSSEAWSLLNSKVRHDMLNQLTAILGYLELSADMVTDPLLIEFFQKEQGAAEKIREKLIFTRDYQKLGMTEFTWYDLNDLLQEILSDIPMENLKISISVDSVRIFGDKSLKVALGKIIENIPLYAKDATNVSISIIQNKGSGILIIEDDGCGIPSGKKNRIFDLGYGEGNGNGLFLAEKISAIFGIIITETGEEGKGARFELNIPGYILNFQ